MAILTGGSGNDTLTASGSDNTFRGGDGDDTLTGGSGVNWLYGDGGNDHFVVNSRFTYVSDSAGTDSAQVNVDWYKTNTAIENWTWAAGVQKLPYWIDALLPDQTAGLRFTSLLGSAKTFTYFFPASATGLYTDADASGYTAANAAQQSAVLQAMAHIASTVDLHFVAGTTGAVLNQINIGANAQVSSSAYGRYPDNVAGGSDMFFNVNRVESQVPLEGNAGAYTVMHQFGISLGLKHPWAGADTTGYTAPGPYLPSAENGGAWTMMSNVRTSEQYRFQFEELDLAALHYLYGPSKTARTGNDTYRLDALAPNFIWDGGGSDTLDGSALSQNLVLHLEPGHWGYVGSKSEFITAAGQQTVNFGSEIEMAKGGSGHDSLTGNALANTLWGNAGNDGLNGGAGNDTLIGGAGLDTAGFSGTRASYSLAFSANGVVNVTHHLLNGEGTDLLSEVERIKFSDRHVALDTAGNAGQAYRLYRAAFDRAPDLAGLGYQITALDQGASLLQVGSNFIGSPEFAARYGALDNSQFVTQLYQNVLHRAPDAAGLGYHVGNLASGMSRTEVLVGFSESPENQAAVIGTIAQGMDYLL